MALNYGGMTIRKTDGMDVFMSDECVTLQRHITKGMEGYLAQVLEHNGKTDPSQNKVP